MFVLSISNFWKKEQKATSFVCLHEIGSETSLRRLMAFILILNMQKKSASKKLLLLKKL